LEKLPPNTVKWGKECHRISHKEDGKVFLEFKDGEISEFDAVIGWYFVHFLSYHRHLKHHFSDGVRSIVRDHIVGDKLNYLGVIAINGIATDFTGHDTINNRSFHSLDGCNRLFVKPFSNNSWMWQLTFPMDEANVSPLLHYIVIYLFNY
jgi:hypothetical protein